MVARVYLIEVAGMEDDLPPPLVIKLNISSFDKK